MEGDFLDVFEPWTAVREPAARSAARKARARAWEPLPRPGVPEDRPIREQREPEPIPDVPADRPHQRALEGADGTPARKSRAGARVLDSAAATAEFLREEAIPEITLAASHVKAVDHQLVIQDMLDMRNPALRVLFWPRPGLMAASWERTRITLEFTVLNDDPCEIVARCWSGDPGAETSTSLGRIPVGILDLDWVRERVLDLIQVALRES